MKLCPRCKSSYTDDTLAYCLQDGAALIQLTEDVDTRPLSSSENTVIMGSGTVGFDPHNAPTEVLDDEQTVVTQQQRVRPTTNRTSDAYVAPQQNTALLIVLTALVTVILVVLAIGGLWFLFKDRRNGPNITSDNNSNYLNQNKNSNKNSNNTNNSNNSNNGNTEPTPTPKPIDQTAIRQEVSAVLNGWSSAARARDLESQLQFYGDTVSPYYNSPSRSLSKIREERQRVYALYDTMDVDLTNIKITPDPSGDKAVVVLDKTWTFEGPEKYNSGSVQQKLWLTKIGGRWLITGEKDLKVYYVDRE